MSFAEEWERKSSTETQNRPATAYVKFTPEYRVTLRILDKNAKTIWKHWIPQANKGRGLSAVCPNVTAQTNACPIEQATAHLPKTDVERKNSYARRKFVVNVLDRTPYTTCGSCNTFTPGAKCINCGAALKGHDFKPLNKVKIMEGGPKLFVENINAIDRMQKEDLNKEITDYDIVFTTSGELRDKKISALPRDPSPLESDALLDETGEPQKLYNLDDLSEPDPIEVINAMLQGASIEEINVLRG